MTKVTLWDRLREWKGIAMMLDELMRLDAGAELDAAVAEIVMGWHKAVYVSVYPNGNVYQGSGEDWLDAKGHFMHGIAEDGSFEDEEDLMVLHWHPSTQYSWLEEIIDRMHESGKNLHIMCYAYRRTYATFRTDGDFEPDPKYWAEGNGDYHFTLAICRAAIKEVIRQASAA